jgi:hypothetical protein
MAISAVELGLFVSISTALSLKVTEVIAGGIFSSITWNSSGKDILYLIDPLFLFTIGFGLLKHDKVSWIDAVNPFACFKKPWPVIMIKISIFRLLIFSLFWAEK